MSLIVSHAKRFICFHIPKCAGTSFREALKPYHDDAENFWYRRYNSYFGCEIDYAHMRLWELLALFPRIFDAMPDYETLALVRSPYERFISALAQHLTAFHPNLDYSQRTRSFYAAMPSGSLTKSFVSSGCSAMLGSSISLFRLGISPLVSGASCVMSYRSRMSHN